MKTFFLCLIVYLVSSFGYSQTSGKKNLSEEIIFLDGTTLKFTRETLDDKFPLTKDNITISSKKFEGALFDVGKPYLNISPKAMAAISKKDKDIGLQIRKKIKIGYGIEQNGMKIGLTGFYAKENEKPLENCLKSEKPCQVKGEAVIIQIKFKDTVENIVLVKSIEFSDRANEQ